MEEYTSEKAKRIMEIGTEVQSIVDNAKGNRMIKRMYSLHEELAILMASEMLATKDEYLRDNEAHNQLLELLYLFLESKDQLEEFDEYVESVINIETTVLN